MLQQVAVLGDYLYIEGGQVSQFLDGEILPSENGNFLSAFTACLHHPAIFLHGVLTWPGTAKSTLSIPLSQRWTNSTVVLKTIIKEDSTTVKELALWPDNSGDRLYRWGGRDYFGLTGGAENVRLWVFTPDQEGGGEWAIQPPANPNVFSSIRRAHLGSSATCEGMGFYLAGLGDPSSDVRYSRGNIPVSGLLTFDMASKVWSNESSASFAYPYGMSFGGQAVCAMAHDTKLVFFLGGRALRGRESHPQWLTFSNITFYDPEAKVWYWQRATGDTPHVRHSFCAAGIRGRDGTFEM